MAYVPSTAAQNTATLAGSNQASLAAPLTSLQSSIAAGNLAPAALVDAILSAAGYQAQDSQTPGADTISSTTYANVFNSWSVTVGVAKTYLLHVDVNVSAITLSGGRCLSFFQVLVNGVAYSIQAGAALIDMISATPYYSGSWRVAVPLNAGSNTIQLQAKCGLASTSFSTAGNGARTFTLTG